MEVSDFQMSRFISIRILAHYFPCFEYNDVNLRNCHEGLIQRDSNPTMTVVLQFLITRQTKM